MSAKEGGEQTSETVGVSKTRASENCQTFRADSSRAGTPCDRKRPGALLQSMGIGYKCVSSAFPVAAREKEPSEAKVSNALTRSTCACQPLRFECVMFASVAAPYRNKRIFIIEPQSHKITCIISIPAVHELGGTDRSIPPGLHYGKQRCAGGTILCDLGDS